MPGVCRAYIDSAGGIILVGDSSVIVEGQPIVVEGNPVSGHDKNEHSNPTMMNGNPRVVVNGVPVCTESSVASCGHTPSGSGRVVIG
jgi:uncharacterized Zn-binding protein involved in type VI secretion